MKVELADVTIVAVVLILLIGLFALAGFDRAQPAYLVDAFKLSIGAVLGRAPTFIANGRKRT